MNKKEIKDEEVLKFIKDLLARKITKTELAEKLRDRYKIYTCIYYR